MLWQAIACVKTSGISTARAGEQHDPRFGPLEEFHQLAYAVLVTSVRDNRRNETYFAKGRLVKEENKPEAGAFIDQVIAEVSEPLGAPELLTTLIANNLDLTHQLVDKRMLHQLAGFVGDHGPRPGLAQILAATLSCHGKAIRACRRWSCPLYLLKTPRSCSGGRLEAVAGYGLGRRVALRQGGRSSGWLFRLRRIRERLPARVCAVAGFLKLPGWRIVLRRPDAWPKDGCERLGRTARANERVGR